MENSSSNQKEDNPVITDSPYPTADSCFYFQLIGHVTPMGYDLFGDADHDSLPEIVGIWGGRSWIYEYSGHDTTYLFQDTIYHASPVDYGHDSDGDGKAEFMTMNTLNNAFTLYESPSIYSLPSDSIFGWPYGYYWGGIADIDGDGQIETYYKRNFLLLEAWRSSGDNQYYHAYDIAIPDSFRANFSGFVFGDFDNDGRMEMVNCSDRGIILEFECVAPDSFVQVWRGQVSHYNANDIAGPSDMDGDGKKEFVVEAKMNGVTYYIFESTGDNSFEQVAEFSFRGEWFLEGGMGFGDFDHDGLDEFVFGTAARFGLIKAIGNDQYEIIYLKPDSSEAIYVYDINNNGNGDIIAIGGGPPPDYPAALLEYMPGRNILGDINCDCAVNLSDPLYLVNYFKGYDDYNLPYNIYSVDVNGDCRINGLDVTYFINYFHSGPAPRRGGCS